MRVAHVTGAFLPNTGGIENFVGNLCVYGKKLLDAEPLVLLLDCKASSFIEQEVAGIPVVRVPLSGTRDIRFLPDLSELLAGTDVIHLHDPQMGGVSLHFIRRRYGPPLLLSTHGGFFHTRRLQRVKQLYFKAVVPHVLRRMSVVIANSEADERRFKPICPSVQRIDNGIEINRFAPVGELSNPAPRFVYYGRIAPHKHVDRLVGALAALRTRGIDASLTIIGRDVDGHLDNVRKEIAAHGVDSQVRIRDSVDDTVLNKLLSESSYFLSASAYEGFGLTVIEAMAAGRIVLVSDIPQFRSLVSDGKTGFLVDFANPRRAAERIADILGMDRETQLSVAARAREQAREYGWESKIQQFGRLYRGAVRNRLASAA